MFQFSFFLLKTLTKPSENNFFSLMNRDSRAPLACSMNSCRRSQGEAFIVVVVGALIVDGS